MRRQRPEGGVLYFLAMAEPKTAEHPISDLYDLDFHAWVEENLALLRQGRLAQVDLAHLADELEDMGRREQRELTSRLGVLVAHLLQWQHQPDRRSASWINTVSEQRLQLEGLLEQSPSLRRELPARIERACRYGVKVAAKESGYPQSHFPTDCPYGETQILDPDFWPGDE
jgi:hypothetical protein